MIVGFPGSSPALAFMHIPKTGGSTLQKLLTDHFEPEQVFPSHFNEFHKYSRRELLTYELFCGHFDWQSVQSIPRRFRVVTMLREPKARILSLYYYWKSHRPEVIEANDLTGPRLARSMNLLEFLRSPQPCIRINIDNVQTRTIVAGSKYAVGPGRELSSGAVLLARERLATCLAVGVMERYEESVQMIWQKLGLQPPSSIPALRSSRFFGDYAEMEVVEREPITPQIVCELARLSRFDASIYSYASACFSGVHSAAA